MIKMYTKILSITLTLLLTCSITGYTQLKVGDQLNLTKVAVFLSELSLDRFQDFYENLSIWDDSHIACDDEKLDHVGHGLSQLLYILDTSWIFCIGKYDTSTPDNLLWAFKYWVDHVCEAAEKVRCFKLATHFHAECYKNPSQFFQAPYETKPHNNIFTTYDTIAYSLMQQVKEECLDNPTNLAYLLEVHHRPLLDNTSEIYKPTHEKPSDRTRRIEQLLKKIIYIYLSDNKTDISFDSIRSNLNKKVYELMSFNFSPATLSKIQVFYQQEYPTLIQNLEKVFQNPCYFSDQVKQLKSNNTDQIVTFST